jgi:hypothetical protein
MRDATINDIEKINVIILVLGSVASIAIMRDYKYLFSFAVASSIMTLNFRLLRKILEGFFTRSIISKKELLIKLPLKFFGVIALIVVIVLWGDINISFFVMGLSTVFVSIIINQVVSVFYPAEVRRKQDGA